METFVFIYAKDGKVRCLDIEQAKEQATTLIADGWQYTTMLNSCAWIEYLCNHTKGEKREYAINVLSQKVNQ